MTSASRSTDGADVTSFVDTFHTSGGNLYRVKAANAAATSAGSNSAGSSIFSTGDVSARTARGVPFGTPSSSSVVLITVTAPPTPLAAPTNLTATSPSKATGYVDTTGKRGSVYSYRLAGSNSTGAVYSNRVAVTVC